MDIFCSVHTHSRFQWAHLKQIRLSERCQGPVMREKPVCLMLCGGCLVAPLSHLSPQETLSRLIRNRTSCLRSQAPADISPSSSCFNVHCICNAGVIWLKSPYLTFLIFLLCYIAIQQQQQQWQTHLKSFNRNFKL